MKAGTRSFFTWWGIISFALTALSLGGALIATIAKGSNAAPKP